MTYQKSKTFSQLTAAGTTSSEDVSGVNNHNVSVTVASINTNVIIALEGSLDGTNYFEIPVDNSSDVATGALTLNRMTITANGTYSLHVKNYSLNSIRLNFVSEAGGSAATIDAVYQGTS